VNLVALHLKPAVFKQVATEIDVTRMFATLKAKYHQEELSNRLYASLKLQLFKMKDGDSIDDHIDKFNDMVVDLENLGEDMGEERKAINLLGSLPLSYLSLSRVILHRDRKHITYNEVVSALKSDALQQQLFAASTPSTSNAAALNVSSRGESSRGRPQKRETRSRSKSRSKSPGKSEKRNVCWKCGKPGHMKKDCQSKSKNTSANVAVSADDETDLLDDDYVL
jgi:hypothetical protein